VLTHHLGHAFAARSTGHPMRGIAFWGVIGTSLYPPDEPPLPAAVHRRRALGGPPASALYGLLLGWLALALRRRGGAPYRVAQFLCFDNLVGFALGSLLPLGFTDGSTLLRLHGED
jgi:hypothetical protein